MGDDGIPWVHLCRSMGFVGSVWTRLVGNEDKADFDRGVHRKIVVEAGKSRNGDFLTAMMVAVA